jgi:hypothetical protein
MKKLTAAVFLIFLYLVPHSVYAMIKVFLLPRVVHEGKALQVQDVANVTGDLILLDKIKNTVIEPEIYKDGFIERKELFELLKKSTAVSPLIFGSAVRVVPAGDSALTPTTDQASREQTFIKKGDTVDVIIRRKNISIEMIGVSMVDATEGETVTVELQNRKQVKGVLKKR